MSTSSPVYLLNVTSGRIQQLITYLQRVADDLGRPRELGVIFPRELNFDFSRIRVSVQLSEERLRYEEARQREQDRAAGIWDTDEKKEAQRYARRSSEEYEEQAKRTVVKDWEDVRGDIHRPQVSRAIILGDPGFGKTWLLRYEGRKVALAEIERLKKSQVGTYHADDDSYYLHVRCEKNAPTSPAPQVGYVVKDQWGKVAMLGDETIREPLIGEILLTQQADDSWYAEAFFLNREETQEFAPDYEVFVSIKNSGGA